MIRKPNYKLATNTAYQELQNYTGSFPQIDVYQLLENHPNVALRTYTEVAEKYGCTQNEFAYQKAPSEFGFTISNFQTGKHIIFFNDMKNETTTRFTIVHELGHICLNHNTDDKVSQKEADCFARNILCPVPIIEEYKMSTPKEYSDCFNISLLMAEVAIEYYSSDYYYLDKNLYEKVRDKIYCYMTGSTLAEIYGCY